MTTRNDNENRGELHSDLTLGNTLRLEYPSRSLADNLY